MTAAPARAVLVGDVDEPHLAAVLGQLATGRVVVINGATVATSIDELSPAHVLLRDLDGRQVEVRSDGPRVPGWIRRLAPAGWDQDVRLGSQEAAALSSRLSLLAAVLRDSSIQWLSDVDALFAAENKLVQYRAATRLGLRVPRTLVGWSAPELGRALGEPFVLKPLGPGGFAATDGAQRAVFARTVTAADLDGVDLAAAPFLAQQYIDAQVHLRVATVRSRSWVTALDAQGLPCDWRKDRAAHDGFVVTDDYSDVAKAAVDLAMTLGCGYSSQDWIVDATGAAFIDLNPGGQWLFLPEPVRSDVTAAIADTLGPA